MEILELVSSSRSGFSLNEIVEKTGIPKTTAYEILLMLQETGMLQAVEGKVKRYSVGLKAFLIGNRYIQNMNLVQEAIPYLDSASDQLNMTVFIAMLDGNQIIYLYKKEPDQVPISTANVSNREDAYCTSLGKAIMAYLPVEELEQVISTMDFRRRTEKTIMNPGELREDLRLTRERGYSLDNREILDFVMCIGAPVFDHTGRVVGGISAAGLYTDQRDTDREGAVLMRTAEMISRRMGYACPQASRASK